MIIARTKAELREALAGRGDSSVGLVPTMGALHEGHLALIRAAREECDLVVATSFVNPAQFGEQADLDAYPRDPEADARAAAQGGVDILFVPEVDEVYPPGFATWVEPDGAADGLEGEHRPGHFRGVATVCLKLFNLVRPRRAYFGRKDAQQVAVIKQLVRDLDLERDLEIRVVPTVRDADGLAISSRNVRLSDDDRRPRPRDPARARDGRPRPGPRSARRGRARARVRRGRRPRRADPRGRSPRRLDPPDRQRPAGRRPRMTTRPRTPAPNAPAPGKLPLTELVEMKRRGEKIVMVTAYDAPSGALADAAGVDLVLVGDSAAMTVLGHDSTVPATMEEMLVLSRATTRGARRPIVIADMPFGSFQVSDEQAVENGIRFVKEAGVEAVKLEGAGAMLSRARALVDAGIPVMGHIGLTPQSATMLGGFKAQGRSAEKARALLADARALEAAGCFALVLEAVPAPVAERITSELVIPTIGIGAGGGCDGQVLVWHDLLGLYEGSAPRFVKQYADLAAEIRRALEAYVAEVRNGDVPRGAAHLLDPGGGARRLRSGGGGRAQLSASIP